MVPARLSTVVSLSYHAMPRARSKDPLLAAQTNIFIFTLNYLDFQPGNFLKFPAGI
jgi:hypothetical protein